MVKVNTLWWFLSQWLAHWPSPRNIECNKLYMEFSMKYLTKIVSKGVKVSSRVFNTWCNLRRNTLAGKAACSLGFQWLQLWACSNFNKLLLSRFNPWSVPPFRIGGAVPTVFSYFSEVLAREKRGEHLSWLCMFWMIGGIYASAMAWAIIPHYGKKNISLSFVVLLVWKYSLNWGLLSVLKILTLLLTKKKKFFLLVKIMRIGCTLNKKEHIKRRKN